MCKAAQLQIRQASADAGMALGRRPGRHSEQQIFGHGHVGKKQVILEQDADLALLGGQGVDAPTAQRNGTREMQAGRQRAADRSQQTGFTRAAGTHDGMDLARLHLQREIADQHAVGAGQLFDVNLQWHGDRWVVHGWPQPVVAAGCAACAGDCVRVIISGGVTGRRLRTEYPPWFEGTRMKKLIVVAMLAAAGVAYAESTPAKKELVTKVLLLQQPAIELVARAMAEQPAQLLMQRAGPLLQQRIPPDKRQAVAREIQADLKKYVDEAVPVVRDRAVALAPSTIGVLLDERFTEDELKQLIAIIESPVNRKFQALGGEMQKDLSEKLVAETKPVIEAKVRALDRAVAARLGIQPPAAGASK